MRTSGFVLPVPFPPVSKMGPMGHCYFLHDVSCKDCFDIGGVHFVSLVEINGGDHL